jgi:SAM-dependent MidA family methyltransferase
MVANYMMELYEKMGLHSLNILEIGPGRGAFADSILDFLKNYNLKLYRNVNYKFVEISPVLA